MKTIFKLIAPMAVAALALMACQRESVKNQEIEGSQIIKVHATAQDLANEDTRTYIDTYNDTPNTILWGTGEYMKLCVTSVADGTTENKWANSTDDSADLYDGEPEALFEFSVSPQDAPSYLYQGLYPASAAVNSNNDNPASYKVNLLSTQNATASSYDPAAYIMVAKPQTFDEVETDWLASYRRATALNKITLKNVPSGVSIKRVTITAPSGKYLAGARHIDLSTGESGDIYSGGGRTETVEVKYETPLAGGANIDVWFTSWEVEVAAGEVLTIVVYTTDKKSYTKTITVPENKTISFKEGYLNTLGANISGITPEDVTEMEEGSYVVLAKDGDNYYALKAEKESGKERLLSVQYTGTLDSYDGDADIIWNLTKSGDSFIFENDDKYLGYQGTSNESYWLAADENWTTTNYLLDVTAQETAGLYYVTLHSNSSRYLSKNSSGGYFAFYGNTNQKANIVFVPAKVDTRAELVLSFDEPAITLTTDNYVDFEGQYATAYSDGHEVTGLEITYSWDIPEEDSDFGAIDETGYICLGGEVGVTATVTASFEGNETYRAATASYTITVTDNASPDVLTLSFPFTSAIDGWPASSSASAAGSYTYPLSGTNYTFTHTKVGNGIYCAGSYLMIVSGNYLGLPAIEGYKLTKVSAQLNDGGNPSTASKGNITSDTAGTVVTGGEEQTFDTKGGIKTFTLTGTEENTVYYLAISNKNFQCIGIDLEYELVAPDTREEAGMSWSAATASATITTGQDGAVITFTAPTLDAGNASDITYESTSPDVATVTGAGVVTIVGPGETTIKAIFAGDEDYKPQTVSYVLTVTDERETVATPVIDPASGTVASGSQVTITCGTSGAVIHYTLDGSAPTAGSTTYTDPITLTATKTIKAIAVKAGYKDSAVATANLTVGVTNTSTEANPYSAAEAVDLAGQLAANGTLDGVYVSGIISEITQAYSPNYGNVTFTISEDGLTTGTQFTIFRIPAESADDFKVGDAVEIKGTLKNYKGSNQTTTTPELTADFTTIYQYHAPTFTPNGGSFNDSQSVTISADNGATIRYTVNGDNPTATTGTEYSGAFTLTETTTVKALAIKNGITSGVVSATFTKNIAGTTTDIYTFSSNSWAATLNGNAANWTSGKAGAGFTDGQGVQVTTNSTGANATSPVSFSGVSRIVVTYNTNKSAGAGTIAIQVGSNTAVSNSVAYGGSGDGRSQNYTTTYDFDPSQTGKVKITVNTTTNSIWVKSIAITHE